MGLAETIKAGDLRKSLEALRDHLAAEIEAGDAPTAPLAKQLADVLKAIAALPSGEERSIQDELADRRQSRGSGASKRTAGEKVAGGGRRRSGGSRRSSA